MPEEVDQVVMPSLEDCIRSCLRRGMPIPEAWIVPPELLARLTAESQRDR